MREHFQGGHLSRNTRQPHVCIQSGFFWQCHDEHKNFCFWAVHVSHHFFVKVNTILNHYILDVSHSELFGKPYDILVDLSENSNVSSIFRCWLHTDVIAHCFYFHFFIYIFVLFLFKVLSSALVMGTCQFLAGVASGLSAYSV